MGAPTALEGKESRRAGPGVGAVPSAVLLLLAALGWWWSARMVDDMTGSMPTAMGGMDDMGGGMDAVHDDHELMSFGAFLFAWLAMMTAMMYPAVAPVVRLYGRAAAMGRVAPLPFFVAGYTAVWVTIGVPAYVAWRELMEPIDDGRVWAARLAGAVLIGAAVWQLTPLKSICLRHCRSPMSFFLRFGSKVSRPAGALRMGATHGLFCLGCCWALMAVLVALGTMNLAWMVGLAVLILVEKNASFGEGVARLAAVAFAGTGVALLLRPENLTALT